MAKVFVVKHAKGLEVLETAKEVVEVLGKKCGISTTQRAVLAGTHDDVVQFVDSSEVEAILAAEGQDTALTNTPVSEEVSTDTQDAPAAKATKSPKKEAKAPVAEATDDIEYPEVGAFKDEKAMKKFYKKLTNAQIQEWCELEGVTWKPNDNEAINRMRMVMAIKHKHFPHLAPKPANKPKSKYAQYTTEELVQMAADNDINVTGDNGDIRILRMKTIMALREAGIVE